MDAREKTGSWAGCQAGTAVTIRQRLTPVWEKVLAVWRYELTSVEDRPITVSKICIGLLLRSICASR